MHKKVYIIIFFALFSAHVFGDVPVFNEANRNKSFDELWQIFLDYADSQTKADMLAALAMREKGNRNNTDKINNYLMGLNSLFRSGKHVDYRLVSASITAIVELNDVSSYPVLFDVLNSGYPEVISAEAYGALDVIDGDLYQFITDIIEKNPPQEKYFALKTATNNKKLSISQRGRLASFALEKALDAEERNVYSPLNGIWELRSRRKVTIGGSTGVINSFGFPSASWLDAINKNYVKLGDQDFRSIERTGNLTWSGECLMVRYNLSAPDIAIGTTWEDCTITMNANEQTFVLTTTDSSGNGGTVTETWRRSTDYVINYYELLRYAAVLEITSLGWTNANALIIRNYYHINENFLRGADIKNRLIEAITCLGAAGNMDAALVLALQLGFINLKTEKTGVFDSEITLAIVRALGSIGANASFDHLIHVTQLSYPEYIKIAAWEAVDRLKW
jgi:hypothetical protein